ncbi:MAG: class I SAM-dependent methyltransferase [Nitrospiraceae bacterium]
MSRNLTDRLLPNLLPRRALVKSSDVDQPALNFHPLLGIVARLRFWMILSLLPARRFSRLLEIGYGSGVFLPELARHCEELYGLDTHGNADRVLRSLREHHVSAALLRGSATALPYEDRSFDCIVAVSCLEYMDSFDCVAREIKRVLRSDGCFVFVTPGNSPLIDLGHDLLTGRRVKAHYKDRRMSLIATLKDSFVIQRELAVPKIGGGFFTLYRGMSLTLA